MSADQGAARGGRAPWSADEVANLEAWQACSSFHGYTCDGLLCGLTLDRALRPTTDGWVCACGQYRQQWAHPDHLARPPAPRRFWE